jgi:hypothetical protein
VGGSESWWAVVNTVMNLRVPYSARSLLLCEELSAFEEGLRYTESVSDVGITPNFSTKSSGCVLSSQCDSVGIRYVCGAC